MIIIVSLVVSLWGWNEGTHRKQLEQCLPQNKPSVNSQLSAWISLSRFPIFDVSKSAMGMEVFEISWEGVDQSKLRRAKEQCKDNMGHQETVQRISKNMFYLL